MKRILVFVSVLFLLTLGGCQVVDEESVEPREFEQPEEFVEDNGSTELDELPEEVIQEESDDQEVTETDESEEVAPLPQGKTVSISPHMELSVDGIVIAVPPSTRVVFTSIQKLSDGTFDDEDTFFESVDLITIPQDRLYYRSYASLQPGWVYHSGKKIGEVNEVNLSGVTYTEEGFVIDGEVVISQAFLENAYGQTDDISLAFS